MDFFGFSEPIYLWFFKWIFMDFWRPKLFADLDGIWTSWSISNIIYSDLKWGWFYAYPEF